MLMAEILHQLIGSLPHCLQGFIHPRWCRISSINSSDGFYGSTWFVPFFFKNSLEESTQYDIDEVSSEIEIYKLKL